jgi:hypothetical protein
MPSTSLRKNLITLGVGCVAGVAIFALHHLVLGPALPAKGEYFFTNLIKVNYTWSTAVVFAVAAAAISRLSDASPFIIAAGTVLVFPLATFYEASAYRGSHNLLPFEFIMWAVYALPALLGALIEGGVRRAARKHTE